MASESTSGGSHPLRLSWWVALVGFLTISVFFLWSEHKAHILGVLPWALLALCPLLHVFMHGSHGHGGHDSPGDEDAES